MPFQGRSLIDDDEYTDEQRAGMMKALRMFQKEPTQEEIIKKHKLNPKYKDNNTEDLRFFMAETIDEYHRHRECMNSLGLRWGRMKREIENRKILEKMGIDYWGFG